MGQRVLGFGDGHEKSQTVKSGLAFRCPVIRTEAHRERLVRALDPRKQPR